MAVVIRILIHQTSQSTSLLKHLNATKIDFLTTRIYNDEKEIEKHSFLFGLGMARLGDEPEFVPSLDSSPWARMVPVSEWWNQVVCVLDRATRLTRKDIVLTAGNKDGGAHVDASLTPEYEKLAGDGVLGSFVYPDGHRQSIGRAHFIAIRQMGYELLNSPELLKLAE